MTTYTDLTDRVREMNEWTFEGLTIRAHHCADESASPLDAECYTPAQLAAWRRGEWEYVGIIVEVLDTRGVVWGVDSLWGIESGQFLITDEHDAVVETRTLDPLTDKDGQLPDIIREAMADAAETLAGYVLPTLAPVAK